MITFGTVRCPVNCCTADCNLSPSSRLSSSMNFVSTLGYCLNLYSRTKHTNMNISSIGRLFVHWWVWQVHQNLHIFGFVAKWAPCLAEDDNFVFIDQILDLFRVGFRMSHFSLWNSIEIAQKHYMYQDQVPWNSLLTCETPIFAVELPSPHKAKEEEIK